MSEETKYKLLINELEVKLKQSNDKVEDYRERLFQILSIYEAIDREWNGVNEDLPFKFSEINDDHGRLQKIFQLVSVVKYGQ